MQPSGWPLSFFPNITAPIMALRNNTLLTSNGNKKSL